MLVSDGTDQHDAVATGSARVDADAVGLAGVCLTTV